MPGLTREPKGLRADVGSAGINGKERSAYLGNLLSRYSIGDTNISFQEWLVGQIMKTENELRALENEYAASQLTLLESHKKDLLTANRMADIATNAAADAKELRDLSDIRNEDYLRLQEIQRSFKSDYVICVHLVPNAYFVEVVETKAFEAADLPTKVSESRVYGRSIDLDQGFAGVMEAVRNLDISEIHKDRDALRFKLFEDEDYGANLEWH